MGKILFLERLLVQANGDDFSSFDYIPMCCTFACCFDYIIEFPRLQHFIYLSNFPLKLMVCCLALTKL